MGGAKGGSKRGEGRKWVGRGGSGLGEGRNCEGRKWAGRGAKVSGEKGGSGWGSGGSGLIEKRGGRPCVDWRGCANKGGTSGVEVQIGQLCKKGGSGGAAVC